MKNLFPIQQITQTKVKEEFLNNVPFGKYFSDHMLVSMYDEGQWHDTVIKPYQALEIMPGNVTFHYGQAIFEGMRAVYSNSKNAIGLFRIKDHWKRLNQSALRLLMPAIDEAIFIEGLKQLLTVDAQWVSHEPKNSLYLRPFMFAKENFLGVRAANSYYFIIITSPMVNYYDKPVKVYVEDIYARVAKGGLGHVKAAANYAASLLPAQRVVEELGYDQVLWTDDVTHEYLQEIGTMNIFFLIDNVLITPDLKDQTILGGITRDSIIQLCKKKKIAVEERRISKQELVQAYKSNKLTAAFGCGTAAVTTKIEQIKCDDILMNFDVSVNNIADELKQDLSDIRQGIVADDFGWMTWI